MDSKDKAFVDRIKPIEFVDENQNNNKILIFSDIHANIQAYDLLIKYANEKNIGKMICLGDIIGRRYPDINNKLIDKLRKEKRIVAFCQGNWDFCVANDFNPEFMGESRKEEAKSKSEYLRKFISKDNLDWISNLKPCGTYKDFSITHVPGFRGKSYNHKDYPKSNKTINNLIVDDLIVKNHINFYGHTHEQEVYEKRERKFKKLQFASIFLNDKYKYFINPGSIGEKGEFGILDGRRFLSCNIYSIYRINSLWHSNVIRSYKFI